MNVSAMIEAKVASPGCLRGCKQASYVDSVHGDGEYCKGLQGIELGDFVV